jgi:hypothetical protein
MTLLPRMHDGPIAEEGKWLDPMPRVYPLIPLMHGTRMDPCICTKLQFGFDVGFDCSYM